jgi:hypothetical protein
MKNILTVLVLFISLNLMSQGKESYFGVRVGYLSMDNYTPRKYGGIEFDFQFENNIGIQYSFLGGKNYFHMPLAPSFGYIVGLSAAAAASEADERNDAVAIGVIVGIITTIIPESVSYNIPLSDNFSVCPYISPLQLDFFKKEGNAEGDWMAGLGAGSRVHVYMNDRKFRISPYVEYKVHYQNDAPQGFTFGVNLAARMSEGF